MKTSLKEYFVGKSVSLLGAGISNMPLAEMLAPWCERLTVRDKKSADELGENGQKLISLGAELITGEDYLCGIDEDIVFRSPESDRTFPSLKRQENAAPLSHQRWKCSFHSIPAPHLL